MNDSQWQLVIDNRGLAAKMICQMLPGVGYEERDEMVSAIGLWGLMDAARRWTPGRLKFTTYAGICIRRRYIDLLRARARRPKLVHEPITDRTVIQGLQNIIAQRNRPKGKL